MPTTLATQRPAPGEHIPYYAKYIDLVQGDDALAALDKQMADTLALLRTIPESKGEHRYAPGKWSIKETLGHVIDGERVFAYRALRFARADQTPLPGFDENTWVPAAASDRRTVADLADELVAVRAASVALYRSLDLEALARRGEANGKAISVRALAWITAGHAIHHQGILRERYGLGG